MTENSEGESGRKAGLDRSRDRGAYAVEEEISKRISLPPLSNYAPTFGVGQIWHRSPAIRTTKFLSAFLEDTDFIYFIFYATFNCYRLNFFSYT